jgi:uncharacterized protein
MIRSEYVLAALAGAGEHASFTPAQLQKFFFLLDREAAHLLEGPYFNFQPYDYGPFDRMVYEEVGQLSRAGEAAITAGPYFRDYRLTAEGLAKGSEIYGALDEAAREYIQSAAKWVRSINFQQLVSAIYAKYPDMKVNSIFRQ